MVDLTVDISPFLVRSAGVKTYLYHWLRSVQEAASSSLKISTFPVEFRGEPLVHEGSVFNSIRTFAGLAHLSLFTRSILPAGSLNTAIFHATNLCYRPPAARAITTTLHDVTYALFPELHTAATLECHRRFDSRVIPHCSRIVCVSAATRNDAVRVLRLPEERFAVIHPGVDERFFHVTPADCQHVRQALGLPPQYVLFLSTIEPRKNLDRILDAYTALPADVIAKFPLIVAGAEGWKSEATVARVRELEPRVRYLGYVDEQWIPALTAEASAFVYPSLYEGFGFPLAQAMAAGVPAITSNCSSMPEVAGDAAILVDPADTTAIRDSLRGLLTSPSTRDVMGAKARARAQQFTWKESGRKSVQFFLELLS